jgi:hypothetical protein
MLFTTCLSAHACQQTGFARPPWLLNGLASLCCFALFCFCRLRDAEAAASKAAAELSKQQAARMRSIAAVLEGEEKEYQKQLARQEFDRQVGPTLTCNLCHTQACRIMCAPAQLAMHALAMVSACMSKARLWTATNPACLHALFLPTG